jgi:type 1 glutamine amidotransferase
MAAWARNAGFLRRAFAGALLLAAHSCARPVPAGESCGLPAPAGDVLVFTRTTGFRHDSIPAGIAALKELGTQGGYVIETSEDPCALSEAALAHLRVVVFLNTSGTILQDEQRSAVEKWVRAGGGFVGVHAAADTEYDWPYYGELLGTRFASHPAIQTATIRVTDSQHPVTAGLPATWTRRDEWYNFRSQPGGAQVLAELDESTYSGGQMGQHHPILWVHESGSGRCVYFGGGHTAESYAEPLFRSLLLEALRFASGDARP